MIQAAAFGFAADLKKITLDQAISYKEDEFFNPRPEILGWADDLHYYCMKNEKLYLIDASNAKETPAFSDSELKTLTDRNFSIENYTTAVNDYSRILFTDKDTIYLYSKKENVLEPILENKPPASPVKNPTFSPDGKKIAYTRQNDLYVFDTAIKTEIRLTRDGSDVILNGYASWVYYEEILGRGSKYKAFWWSPDSTRIAFMRFDQTLVPVFNIYDENGDYGSLETVRYPKPGYPNPTVKIGIASFPSKEITWIDFNDPADHYLAFPTWNKQSSRVYFQWINRGQDHLKVLYYDLVSRQTSQAYEEKQNAWVDIFESGDIQILGNDDLVIRSSKDGWYHIYYIPQKGAERRLTHGDWCVNSIEKVNEKTGSIYFTANKEDSTETDFYVTDSKGKKLRKLTDFKGTHTVQVSSDGKYFIDQYSSIDTPGRTDLRETSGKPVRKISDRHSPLTDQYAWAKVELFRIKTADGYKLPACWYLPPDFDKTKKYPVVMTIYGGPASAIVSNSDSSSYRRGLERYYLAQQGIINIFVDNRASGHFGKKAMEIIHRQLGKWEMADYFEAVKYLKTLPFVDCEKIGIKGHSYGGYIAALAATYGSDYFQYSISGSPVIDWKLYDSVYTERFMDTPQENPEGYKNSSVLSYIGKFKGGLRMTHGTMDDNVHLQNVLQFLNKALDTGKSFELMLYPGNRHGIRGAKAKEYNKADINFWLKHFLGKSIDR